MRRTFAGLTLLALVLPGQAVAGPPERVSGKMVLDEVVDGLRRYRRAKDADARIKLVEKLIKLAPTRDPRVAVALGERLSCDDAIEQFCVAATIVEEFGATVPPHKNLSVKQYTRAASVWWEANEADLRRRAAQLPR
jgi:hypothetical protein